MEIKIIEDKKTWEDFLAEHPESNFLQSWLWGEFQAGLNRKIFRIGFFENDKLVGICFSYIETSKRAKYLVIPAGPILDWENSALVDSFKNKIQSICRENMCSFARVRVQLPDDEKSQVLFQNLGFKKAPMYLHAELTHQLNLSKSEEEIMSSMRKATRYEIRKAEKLGIKIDKEYNAKNADTFIKLQDETAKRQKFVPFSKHFLLSQFDLFIKEGSAILYTAIFENKILAQAFIIFYGNEAVYHYGASTAEGRNYPGAYLIQWEAIKEAKKRGIKRYNFWGVAPADSADHRFSGLSLFKRGFGGEDVAYLPAQDLIINKPKYFLNFIIEKIRRRIRHS